MMKNNNKWENFSKFTEGSLFLAACWLENNTDESYSKLQICHNYRVENKNQQDDNE